MKEKIISQLFSVSDQCVLLATELSQILEKERVGLVSFDIEKITQSTIEKAFLVRQLGVRRKELKRLIGLENEEVLLANADWQIRLQNWKNEYSSLVLKCESNQQLLKHSLRNMDLLLGNLKSLFGNSSVYDQKGKKQDLSQAGKVIEGRF